MQDLRDKLKKAGLVGKAQARHASLEVRRERKRQGTDRGHTPALELEEQRERYEAKLAEQAARTRETREAQTREHEHREAEARLRQLIRSHAVLRTEGSDLPFYFLGRDRRVRRLMTTYDLATRLALGQLAIVEVDDDPHRDHAIVEAPTAQRIEEIDRRRILFWNKPTEDTGDLPCYGSGA
jgi:uncharacterized protein YaiL (DUF2058 family)